MVLIAIGSRVSRPQKQIKANFLK
ncbi:MAG: hypothetical protein AVDCRST_MAG95-3166, partial [uncultured Adhaeribacter sp.]